MATKLTRTRLRGRLSRIAATNLRSPDGETKIRGDASRLVEVEVAEVVDNEEGEHLGCFSVIVFHVVIFVIVLRKGVQRAVGRMSRKGG